MRFSRRRRGSSRDLLRLEASAWRQPVADRQTGRKGQDRHAAEGRALLPAIDRQEEADRLDEMRRGLEQPGALDQQLAHERKLELLEIAQAAMDQLGGSRGGGAGIVALLGEHDLEPAAGGIAGDGSTVNAAANDEKIVALCDQRTPRPFPRIRLAQGYAAQDRGRKATLPQGERENLLERCRLIPAPRGHRVGAPWRVRRVSGALQTGARRRRRGAGRGCG